ncbi:hypothetical protein [Deinococcus yavapaiensis]|uniref:Nucleotidyltransferase-like protein n=1 Tax=Deinococcus yavapaiensis KR-236 TaxID=694435 RepID=A0A318S7F7_9DEIO|nr:hypothetical protein [Deinococcus yavapaiensis]PYE53826.1 hypothetical protein DES52_10784 [Deinococcus yavapaiensis KR-236]
MNDHTRRRVTLAQTLASVYAPHPEVACVVVGGSVARDLADARSDLELGVFWHSPPTDDDRAALLRAGHVRHPRSFPYFPDEDLWLDQGLVDDVRLDIIHRTVQGVEQGIEAVVTRGEWSVYALNALAVLQYALPLTSMESLSGWRERIAVYPPVLRDAVIDAHLEPTPTVWLRQHVERGEWILLYERLVRDQKHLLMVLAALNGVYLPHAEFKWLAALEASLAWAPRDLTARLAAVLSGPPREGVEVLHGLWEETYDLVARHLPEVGQTAKARRWLNQLAAPSVEP